MKLTEEEFYKAMFDRLFYKDDKFQDHIRSGGLTTYLMELEERIEKLEHLVRPCN